MCSCPRCFCTTQKGCSTHPAIPTHLFFQYVSFKEHAVVYTQNALFTDIYSIQYDMSDLDWRHCETRTVRRAVHGSALSQTYGVCRCEILINIEYRAISGQIHRLYFAGLINSLVFLLSLLVILLGNG